MCIYGGREGGSAAHDVASGEWRYPVSQVLAQMMMMVASLVIVLEVLSQGAAAYTASLTTVVTSYAAAYAYSVTKYHAAAAAGRRTARSTFESTHEALAYFSAATVRQVQPEPSPGRASPLHSPTAGVLYLLLFSHLA